ncbi:fructose 2,6-bisphosphatase [Philodulcilactobacillus myokoensis]|uniref:Fructose 2,6-bisphosphatase n=1 Tax=Philodulcilactobacillus myokoensis TaxID=2929573 RepID=A0A9W6B1S8_9LACO|nr:phosphoglycerate mutase family protein [Philodulcilactobacillus myokoensis]GLB47320.1 fructose 2,6-bisphosphatase [Philodulcilactobacillus myokoensis]
MATFNLYIVRHGQTYYNLYNKLQGWSNAPLTEKGKQDAVKIANQLAQTKFAAAYCSDTTRAQYTAQTILNHNHLSDLKQPISSSILRGEFYGYFEGNDINQSWYLAGAPHGVPTFKDIVSKYSNGKAKDFLKAADPFHQAENDEEYWKRWNQGLALMRRNPDIHDGDNVLLVSHSNVILTVGERYGHGKYDTTKSPANGSLTKLWVSNNDVKITGYNIH